MSLISFTDFEADQCEGLLTLETCAKVISGFQNDKTLGYDSFTAEFYVRFWHLHGKIMAGSFNRRFPNREFKDSEFYDLFLKRTGT